MDWILLFPHIPTQKSYWFGLAWLSFRRTKQSGARHWKPQNLFKGTSCSSFQFSNFPPLYGRGSHWQSHWSLPLANQSPKCVPFPSIFLPSTPYFKIPSLSTFIPVCHLPNMVLPTICWQVPNCLNFLLSYRMVILFICHLHWVSERHL